MNLNLQSGGASGGGNRREDGIALVITLLMLSVITFLAVAFLAMTRRDRAATNASVDVNSARSMSDAALSRAQAEIIARMMSQTDCLAYDYTVSRNYINPSGFAGGIGYSSTNVNYDVYNNNKAMSPGKNPADWAQNIANLFYDPRPPVFVVTNPAYSTNSDFRFWVDINRNGRFETNGYIPTVTNEFGDWSYYSSWNGEPEFIGVLSDPLTAHSSSNRFVGRYAYMVLPIGKTLDLNYIHNWAKGNFVNSVHLLTNNVGVGPGYNVENDGFARDQGVGSWELNLAAMLDVLSPWSYETVAPENPWVSARRPYNYEFGAANTGYAFDDAEGILHYRYSPPSRASAPAGNWPNYILPSLQVFFGPRYTNAFSLNTGIDTYCAGATLTGPFVFTNTSVPQQIAQDPWPGSYTSNMFYDTQDLFDTNKTSRDFVTRMLRAEARTNFFDRYTFQRLLSSIGTGSAPEYGVFVYTNSTNAYYGLAPTWLRTKININYDNTAQITNANAPYAPMPTNLVSWAPINFFTNAADLLLRSQEFLIATNIYLAGVLNGANNYVAYYGLAHFGITNIPIYNSTNPTIRYNAKIHRMLQLAANIYDAANGTNWEHPAGSGAGTNVYYPHIFRPQFSVQPVGNNNFTVSITNYVEMNYSNWVTQLTSPNIQFRALNQNSLSLMYSDAFHGRDDNIWGIPWVVGTVRGVPSFNQFSFVNSFGVTRRLDFIRPSTNVPPNFMSQSYEVAVSNFFGTQLWNPYSNAYPKEVYFTLSQYSTVSITNTNGSSYWFTNIALTNLVGTLNPLNPSNIFAGNWSGYTGGRKGGILTILRTNAIALYDSYYSESLGKMLAASNYTPFATYADLHQGKYPSGSGWPVHSWTLNVTNYVLYCMWTKDSFNNPRLLDFVNLGPFGSTLPIIPTLTNGVSSGGSGLPPVGGGSSGPDTSRLVWNPIGANDSPGSPMSAGVLAQINVGSGVQGSSDWPGNAPIPSGQQGNYWTSQINNFYAVLHGGGVGLEVQDPLVPTAVLIQSSTLQANDPLVHYTLDDLTYLGLTNTVTYMRPISPLSFVPLGTYATNLPIGFGQVNPRYNPWGGSAYNTTLFKDPGATSVNAFDFPTNKFPSIGWLGRVHRGTPWQTVYFKPDSVNANDAVTWSNFWVGTYDTYPTNDWILPDLFTAVPNDNAARGLLSVNQTNDAAWAAVFAGLVVPTNAYDSWVVEPTNVYALVDGPGGINSVRTNGYFHHIGDIFRAPALMTNFLGTATTQNTDEIVERVPQQILGLLKVGYPQFVIYSWGQSLRPKNLYFGSGPNFNLCTNYEITGEVLTRTVCHVVSDPLAVHPKVVIDSYNIEPGY